MQSYTLLEPQRDASRTSDTSAGHHAADGSEGQTWYSQLSQISPAFVEEDRFQMFIGLVIFLNIVVLWGETDAPHMLVWKVCDHTFLVIFLVEVILRVLHNGLAGFYCGKDKWWAYLDTGIVALGVFDLWLTPLFGVAKQGKSSTLRFLRLMRLLRLLRVFKMFHRLTAFVSALWKMFGTFIWIFSVLFLFILCFAIMLTHLLGHGEALGDRAQLEQEHAEALASVTKSFQDVPTSLFTLFQLTTTDNWDRIAMPLVEINPWWRLFFVFFIAFASWTMISVLTAVASTNMIEATSDRKDKELRDQELKHKEFLRFLHETFVEADADDNGLLDKEEFSALMEKDVVLRRMKELGIHLTPEELFKAWAMLDIDESGELTIEEFVTGLSYLQEGLATKHILNVDYSLRRVAVKCEDRMDKITNVVDRIVKQNEDILGQLGKQENSTDQRELSFWLWQQWALKHEFGNYCRQQMRLVRGENT